MYLKKKKKTHFDFFQKSSQVQNVTKKSCKLGFHKQSYSLKFKKVGRYESERNGLIVTLGSLQQWMDGHMDRQMNSNIIPCSNRYNKNIPHLDFWLHSSDIYII